MKTVNPKNTQITVPPDLFTNTFGNDFWERPIEERFKMVLGICCQTVDAYSELANERKPNEFTPGYRANATWKK